MRNFIHSMLLFLISLLLMQGCSPKSAPVPSQKQDPVPASQNTSLRLWNDSDSSYIQPACPGKILPLTYRLLKLDTMKVRNQLMIQGPEPGLVSKETFNIEIPLPDGTWEPFVMTQVQVMAPELAAKFPYLKTYSGYSSVYPADQIRLEAGPDGVSAMILSTRGSIMIDPFCKDDKIYMISYFKKNLPGGKEEFEIK
ncbi:MAG: hypothetical protein M3Q95_10460 [Bacteroidota bacterium]|nr:hypothetical protein [Bacteroidota bacterium]